MKDRFAASRLPSLPNAGYHTTREKQLSDEIMTFIRSAERDRLYLVSMVCEGYDKFAKITRKAWRHLRVDDDLIKAVWGYLVLLVGPNPVEQRDTLIRMAGMTPAQKAGLLPPTVKAVARG